MEKSDLQRFRNECVAAHNFYRAAHGTPPICWSTKLAESAQNWADQLASTTGSLRYSSAKGVGENLACLWGSELNGQKVTRIWYEEVQHFDYYNPCVSSRTRSFAQVVWEGTREFGAGAAVTKHGKQIVVARYFPPMNKKDVVRNVKKVKCTRDDEQPLAYDTRWSRLYIGLKEFHEECLSVHNDYRTRHGAAPLHWSADLAWEAQQWAEDLARNGELRHNNDDTVGENLAGMTGGELTGQEAVDMWYEEIESYDFDNHGYSEDTSNFTQVVWVASENLGVGRAVEGDLCVVVAFYEPPGNMEGSFSDNVLRMGSKIRQRKSKEPKGFIPPPPDLEGFRLECLVSHNYFRARHGSPPLVLNSALTDEAQYWAERLLVTGATEGLDNSRIGISVAILDNKHASGIKVSELWYKQISSYDFDSPGFSSETLDFSQLVWMSSRKLGVGKATGAEGVTVVVARYEPVGNIDGLFVQNVKRRGLERGSCEPMIFHVEYKYRLRTDSKSTNSFLSWEHEEGPTLEQQGDNTKQSDLEQIDENENIVHRTEEPETTSTLTVSGAFTRLVWIDPNSPTLQRKGVTDDRSEEVDHGDADDEEEDGDDAGKDSDEEKGDSHEMKVEDDEEDARTAYEQENREESEDIDCVSEEPYAQMEEPELEEADLFSDPEDDLYQRICEVRRSLSLDSESTEPETQKGNVLSKVAFFETFQRSFEAQSPSNSESSFRRSLIQDELEELASRPKRQSAHEEEEQEETQQEEEEEEEEEHECQLEFDDLFPAHTEGDEADTHEDMFEEEAEEEEESLVSVSDTEDVLDFTDYDTRPEGLQDYKFEDNRHETHEFMEDEPSTIEIFDFSDEDASHQYADITETEDKPRLSTKRVFAPVSLGTATEFHKTESYKLCEETTPDSMEDAPESYREELCHNKEATVEVPRTYFTRTLDPNHIFAVTKRQEIDNQMEELTFKLGLLPVRDSAQESNDLSDFDETTEGKLLQNFIYGKKVKELEGQRTPVEEICEATQRNSVESELDFDELLARLERNAADTKNKDPKSQTRMDTEGDESADVVHATVRDGESERSAEMERISSEIGLEFTEQLEEYVLEKQELTPHITLTYECQSLVAADDVETVSEKIEAVERDLKPENAVDLEELQARLESPVEAETPQNKITGDKSDSSVTEIACEAVLRDHDQERERVIEETGLVRVSPDIMHSPDEPLEPLPYQQAPTSPELPEVITENVSAEARHDVRCEINFEELFRRIDEDKDADETAGIQRLNGIQDRVEHYREEKPWVLVFRDHDQERTGNLEQRSLQLEVVPVSADVTHPQEPIEPLSYDITPKSSPKNRLPEVSEHIGVEVRQDVQSEIYSEDIFRRHQESDTMKADELTNEQGFEETEATVIEKPICTSLYVEENTLVAEVVHSAPLCTQHISHESENDIPAEEVEVITSAGQKRPASLYMEENTVIEEIALESPSSPKHIAGESANLVKTEVVREENYTDEGESASQVVDEHQIVTVVHTESLSSQHIAGEASNIESFHKINSETLNDEDNRASLYMEEHTFIKEVTPEVSSSPRHIANEYEQITLLEEVEEEIEKREKDKRASLYAEENIFVDASTLEEASPRTHVAGETVNIDPTTQTQETEVVEQFAGEKRASVFMDEEASVNYVTTDIISSPFHIAGESAVSKSFGEIYEEERGEVVKRASLFLEEDSVINEVVPDTVSSPKHVAAESQNDECFEEIDQEPLEESKRTSMFLEEAVTLGEVITDTPSSPKQLATESTNVETFEEIEDESNEENKRASLFFEETPLTDEVKTAVPPSPKHIAGEIKNVDVFDEVDEEDTEESKRASLFMEKAVTVDEVTANTSSSPIHLAGESLNVEAFEEVETELEDEYKRASVFLEEDSFVDEVKTATSSVSTHIAGDALNITTVEETHEEEDKPNQEHAVEMERDSEATYGSISFETPDETSHTAAEFSSYDLLEVTDDEESPESDYGEHFQDFEGTYGAETLLEPTETMYVAGEIRNKDPHDETVFEEALQVEESLHYDESREKVTTTDFWETQQSLIHIAGELSNVEPREESSEEEKAEEKAFAVEYEETEVHASTVVAKSPQSLLSIAAAALEHKIDTAQQGATEDVTKETLEQQYSEEEHRDLKRIVPESVPSSAYLAHEFDDSPPDEETVEVAMTSEHSMNLYEEPETTDVTTTDVNTKVPLILVNIASEISDYEDENLAFLEEEPQKVLQSDTQRYEYQEETVCEYLPDEQSVAAEVCVSEIVLEKDDKADQRETVEPFEESEGSVSELLSECSSSPLHVSSELKDFQDYETISETYGSETYHVITYEEDDFVSEKSISKGLPSLFITEELVMQDVCEENNILNEQSEVVETAQEYSEVVEPSRTSKILHISQPSSETAAELSDSDFSNGVEEEDELSEREFSEEFEDMKGVGEQTVLKDSGRIVYTSVSKSDPEFAEEGDLLDETDNAQKLEVQEDVVNIEQLTRNSSPPMLTTVNESVVDKEEQIVEHVWEVTTQEKQEATQVEKFTVFGEDGKTSICHVLESKKSFSVTQNNGESVNVGEQGRTMEISHEMEEKVEIFSTRTVHQLSSTTSHVASEYTRGAIEHQFKTNGTCTSRQIESSDELSECTLDRETKDQELEKYEKQFSEEETEVRLLKSEVMEYRAAELQAPLVSPNVTVERETTLVKTMVVQSSAKEDQEEVIMREDRITAILKDDEASLEEELAAEKFEEEIDIMRMDEALSEEEFRGEGAENTDRSESRSPKMHSADGIDKCKEQKDVEVREDDEQKPLYEEEIEIGKGEPFYEEEFEGEVVEVSHEKGESFTLEEHVEVSTFQESHLPAEESLETDEEAAVRTQSPEFEEELEVSVLRKDSMVYVGCTEEVKPVKQTAVFEEELEISAFPTQDEPVEGQSVSQNEIADRSAIFEEELEISTYKTQEEVFEEQHIEEKTPIDGTVVLEDVLEVSALPALEEPTEEECAEDEDHEALPDQKEESKSVDNEEAVEQSDEEESVENVAAQKRRQPLDLSQVDLYDEEESATAARYYVELSSTESLEPTYEEVEEDEPSYPETYVRQGEPLEENLEEFILVRYGDEFESSGEEDISDHREIYVIPEEENDIENNNVEARRVDVQVEEPQQESSHQEGFEDMGLEDIRESPEFDIDDSDELDEEEQRQLEEYERLESFVILEEKLSQVESDDEENGDLPVEEGDENVFHSDVHSSSEETLHEDELGETMKACSIRQAAAPAGTEHNAEEAPQGDNHTHVNDGSDENQETPKERSPETEEPPLVKELSENRKAEELSLVEAGPKHDIEDERLPDLPTEKKDNSELGRTKEDKTEQGLSSDSSGEQGVSSEGSLSSTPSVDLEGLDNFEQDCFLQHNLYRRQHRVKPLKWSEELAEGAKRWAEYLASVNSLESFDGKDVGENLTSVQGKGLNGSETADLWYKEATDYNFEDPAFNAKCGRFTQVIWASSREIGVAKCASNDGTQYIVARYKPAGNILGEFKENVKPPRDLSSRLKRRRSSARRHSKSGAPSTPAEKEKFKTECVISHNYYRTFHSAPPLRWSPLLAAEAHNYAERLAKTDSLTHSGQKDRGENLAYTWDTPLSARGAIEMWYDEAQDYDFENPGFTSDTGHFTQLVWVGTEEFGMGMAVAPDGRNVVVGRYFPPGNVVGQFKENVRPREIDGIP